MLSIRVYMALFGWMNSETYQQYKHLLAENRRLRRELRDARRRGELIDDERPNNTRET